jgi:hypothetical protein
MRPYLMNPGGKSPVSRQRRQTRSGGLSNITRSCWRKSAYVVRFIVQKEDMMGNAIDATSQDGDIRGRLTPVSHSGGLCC